MPLKVLLADDNITAQRMGSKILTDAGYTVVPVSNGAAAVKKIASEKPQLIILDVYMPGYTGLEVCEKVKSAAETARVPVLLTVTSMEPFSPADGNRVKADGVLIKPFEATDLLAVVRKLEGKLNPALDAEIAAKQPLAVEEYSHQSYADWKAEVGLADKVEKPPEMTREVASAPALGIDGLTDTPPVLMESFPPPVTLESRPVEDAVLDPNAPAPAFDLQHVEVAPVIAPPVELEYTSAPPVAVPEAPPAAEFEPTMQAAANDVPVVQEPSLATDPADFVQFATKFGQESPEDVPVGIALETEEEQQGQADAIAEIDDLVGEHATEPARIQPVEQEIGFSLPPDADLEEEVIEASIVEPEMHAEARAAATAAPDELETAAMEPPMPEAMSVGPELSLDEAVEAAPPDIEVLEPEPQQAASVEAAMPEPVSVEPEVHEAATFEPQMHQAASVSPEVLFVPEVHEPASVEHELRQAIQALSAAAAAAAPARKAQPEREVGVKTERLERFVEPEPEPEPEPQEAIEVAAEQLAASPEVTSTLVGESAADMESAQTEAPQAPDMEPPAAAAIITGLDEHQIAGAVDRVLERYKDVLISAIVRELKR